MESEEIEVVLFNTVEKKVGTEWKITIYFRVDLDPIVLLGGLFHCPINVIESRPANQS